MRPLSALRGTKLRAGPTARALRPPWWWPLIALVAIGAYGSVTHADDLARKSKVKPAASTTERAVDRLELDSTSITGNRELPKVMSIVPWKAAEPPAGPDRPMGSLIDELLAPLDRDEFRREIAYYRDLSSQSAPVAPNVNVPGVPQP